MRASAILRGVATVAGFGLGLLAGLVLLAYLTGRVASDRAPWSQWLLWMPTPVAIIAALFGLLGACRPARGRLERRRRRIRRWAAVAAALTVFFAILEHRFARWPGPRDGVRIVHWNLTERMDDSPVPYGAQVVAYDGDVTILTNALSAQRQENVREWLGEGHRPLRRSPFTVLTRLPIQEFRMLVAAEGIWIAFVRIDCTSKGAGLVAMYLIDLPSDPRLGRAEIAGRARTLLDAADPPPADLVVGDFNMTHGSASLHHIFPSFRDAFYDAGSGYGATFPRELPIYHIDHVLLADTVEATRYEIMRASIGRHQAQAVYVKRE